MRVACVGTFDEMPLTFPGAEVQHSQLTAVAVGSDPAGVRRSECTRDDSFKLISRHRSCRALTDDGCMLSSQSGSPTGRFGEAVMAHGIGVIADVVDPARA